MLLDTDKYYMVTQIVYIIQDNKKRIWVGTQ